MSATGAVAAARAAEQAARAAGSPQERISSDAFVYQLVESGARLES
ncbi:hypothetical protein ACQBAT_07540 [Ornithinimicrobium sp. Y1847]